jgi:hypothetical protein
VPGAEVEAKNAETRHVQAAALTGNRSSCHVYQLSVSAPDSKQYVRGYYGSGRLNAPMSLSVWNISETCVNADARC